MIGMSVAFVANTGSILETSERGGKTRQSMRVAVTMPKPNKDAEYGTHWVTLNFHNDFTAKWAADCAVGTQVFVTGKYRRTEGKEGKVFYDVDVESFTKARAGKGGVAGSDDGPNW